MLKMDIETLYVTTISMLILAGVGALLFMARTSPAMVSAMSSAEMMGSAGRYGKMLGVAIPYVLFAVGPLIDLYNRKLHYSVVSMIGAAAIGAGIGFQKGIYGGSGSLSAMTVATAAMLAYLTQDIWAEPNQLNYQVMSTIVSVLLLILQVLNSATGNVLSSTFMNDLAAVGLGTGLGMIGWMLVWNYQKPLLPFFVASEPKK